MGSLTLVVLFLLTPDTLRDSENVLVEAPGVELVTGHCSGCHSLRLVSQNRGDRDDWLETIRWMQKTQNLWQLEPETEARILDYLSSHYGPRRPARRPPIHESLLPPLPTNRPVHKPAIYSVSAPPISQDNRNPSISSCMCRMPHGSEGSNGFFLGALILGLTLLRRRLKRKRAVRRP